MLAIPDDLPDAIKAMTEPLACVLRWGIARSNVKPNSRVVVLGDGAIGLTFVAALANQSEQVFLFGGNEQRLQIGEKFGPVGSTFNYHQISDLPAVEKRFNQRLGCRCSN